MRTKTSRVGRLRACAVALVMMMVASACAPDIPQDPDVERNQIVFDSETGAIPLPSDLALEDDGTLPNLGDGTPSAQNDFYDYLDTLHGWLPSTPLTVPVTGEVDPETLAAEDAMLFRLTESGAEMLDIGSVAFDADANEIVITPAEPLELGTQYGYVLTGDIQDTDGNPLVTAQTLFFALSSQPLVDEEGNITNDLLAQAASPEEAAQLEQLRQFLSPVVDAAIANGAERSNILAASQWHTALDPFAVFDPTAGVVPFPNEFIRGDDGNVGLPLPDDADDLTTAVITELNSRDGFSITADGWLPIQSTNPLDPATITPTSMPLAYVPGQLPELYPEDRYFLEYNEDFSAITFGPTGSPFVQGVTTAGLATTDITDTAGLSLKPSSAFVFLRSRNPVFADGASTVEQLSDEQAQALEDARQAYQQLFLAALTIGYGDRAEISIAWAFDTDVATEYQQQLNAKAEALANEGGSPSATADPTTAEADPADFTNVGLIQRQAAYTTQWFIDPSAPGGLLETPTTQPVPVQITVPSDANCTAPYPVVILGHGLGGEAAGATGVYADRLAEECLATVSLDFPLHGARTPDGASSGELFLTANAIATKNNFLQAVVDLAVLTEVIKEDGLENALDADAGTDLIDETSIGYAGASLGSLIGVNFVATDGDVNVTALTAPGAKLTGILLEGSLSEQILPQLPGDLQPGTFDFFQTINLLQWIVEPGDPWTFAPHVAAEPLSPVTYDPSADEFTVDEGTNLPSNEMLIQMVQDDATIPNSATERLATAVGVSLDDTTFSGVDHGFLDDGNAEAECALDQIAAWLSSGLTSDAALPSELESACGL
ncbi:hypothetical protein FIV42_03185 [Persicimonas caeni]|uniref:SbsA Ig-like domain-containing protein n=1 Tax=Persicimonas caeni TaxID=2292766 RepID=A0A4Y6PPT6_PERCE|nr:Ig-like domain-containing protein [Persicimonas caeni]QDG49775.1 hypothetical protein FIV42_03185 [Persicimonas caeni]QED30996.1 hypothetical protein FRD00_03180 [Persicimonas caeni]